MSNIFSQMHRSFCIFCRKQTWLAEMTLRNSSMCWTALQKEIIVFYVLLTAQPSLQGFAPPAWITLTGTSSLQKQPLLNTPACAWPSLLSKERVNVIIAYKKTKSTSLLYGQVKCEYIQFSQLLTVYVPLQQKA